MEANTALESIIARVTALISEMEAEAFQQSDFAELSMRQVLYLETIIRLSHPSFRELAEALHVSRPSVTALVSRLIKLGYVTREQDDQDLRSFHIVPTDKARSFSRVHARLHQQLVHVLTARLDESEIKQLEVLLTKALAN